MAMIMMVCAMVLVLLLLVFLADTAVVPLSLSLGLMGVVVVCGLHPPPHLIIIIIINIISTRSSLSPPPQNTTIRYYGICLQTLFPLFPQDHVNSSCNSGSSVTSTFFVSRLSTNLKMIVIPDAQREQLSKK